MLASISGQRAANIREIPYPNGTEQSIRRTQRAAASAAMLGKNTRRRVPTRPAPFSYEFSPMI
jgi:hypothetical protein